ncbi:hypothetical protein ACOWPU_10790 [Pseudomonas aeruginosa]|uniref:hypothetical protein n=1 Tax=Pseudomonas aeruginosa TaxID=287 RepID=UPI000FC42A2E|nr:hypothetical protein [Pseudomonas aeruginosa]MDI2220241.1 hypothetical protein [Pseudomonas aeruginosa]RUB43266.1 hypothetical protein IPC1427_30035 [Pseudomonas aeruginosa]RUB62982.1 hypothetical protein IPC1428_30050 [Pseudomonas aeruginosa]HCF9751219.1 hypothetical protein [Pseudomonas aeruginosa]
MNAEEKEFLRELSAMAQQLRRDIEAQQVGLDSSPEARAERRRRVLVDRDFEFFAYTYFPHHIRPPASLFHAHFFKRFPQLISSSSGLKEWWVAPRGEAKSSLLTKVGPCYVVVQGLLQRPEIRAELGMTGPAPYFVDYITLLGAETRLPTKLLEVVKTELLVNASLSLDFPEVCGKGSVWKIGEFVSLSGVKLEAFGAEQAIRGTFHGASRPKLLLGDDLITDKEAKSPTERNNRWDWLEKAIDYLGPPDGSVKYLGVGTVLNKDDPISRAKRTVGHLVHHFRAIETFPAHMDLWAHCEEVMLNDDKPVMEQYAERGSVAPDSALPSFQFYQDNREQMELGAVTSWPGVRSLYWLMRQRAKNKAAFATELQGDPRSDEDKTFTNPRFWVMRSGRWQMFGACDPSVGASAQSDPSAIIVGGWDTEKQVLNVIEAAIKRRVPSKLESDLIKAQREYQMRAIGFENNGAFEIQRQNIAKAALMQRVALPLVGVTSMADQSVRIDAMEPFINDAFAPRILFSPGLVALLDELDSWPEPQTGHHYDGLCALSILWMIASTRAGSFEFTAVPNRRNALEAGGLDDSFDTGGRFGGAW